LSIGGVIWRLATAFVLAPPLTVCVLFLADRQAEFNVVDTEGMAFLLAFVSMSLPGLLLALAIGWYSRLFLAEFGAWTALIAGTVVTSLVNTAIWVAGFFLVLGLELENLPLAGLLLPLVEGAIAGGILTFLTTSRINKATENG
jgi:hypothetical protein